MEQVRLTTSDGHLLEGDLALAAQPSGAAVLCHPHPQYGGSRFDRVVDALIRALPTHSIDALRFDFRRTFGGGIAERLDVVAAIDLLAERRPAVPVHLIGYSFGAMVALGVRDERVAGHVLIAPPLVGEYATLGPPTGPTLLLVPEHDQFCGPTTVAAATDGWSTAGTPELEVRTITMADHFLAGRVDAVVEATLAWLGVGD